MRETAPPETAPPETVPAEDHPAAGPTRPTGGPHRFRRELRGLAREARSWPTLLLVFIAVCTTIPLAILLTPPQDVATLGQHVSIDARPPSLSVSGPAQLVQVGNTSLDIPKMRVFGPVRPRLEMGPAVRSDEAAQSLNPSTRAQAQSAAARTIAGAWLRWCGWGYLVVLGVTLGAAAVASCIRLVRHQDRQRIGRMVVVCFAATSLAWGLSCAATVAGASGLRQVRSFADLVGQYHLSPSPVGPKLYGYEGAVIGDSRASRVGGPPLPNPTRDDRDCQRSSDSLAAEIGLGLSQPVLNLACPSATIEDGVMAAQARSGRLLPPQMAVLKQVQNLKFVVVVVGPNDLWWSDFIRYCYGADICNDNFIKGNFEYRLSQFDHDYGDLLADLNDLPSHPQVIVMASYDVFDPDAGKATANCPDARGPAGVKGLTPEKINFLVALNNELNSVLASGADKYKFDVATPHLTKLCEPNPDGLGPDLQGLRDPDPFHPTALGVVRLAASVLRLITSPQPR
jgi:GDSL-like Lipase/Acylhydrolase family